MTSPAVPVPVSELVNQFPLYSATTHQWHGPQLLKTAIRAAATVHQVVAELELTPSLGNAVRDERTGAIELHYPDDHQPYVTFAPLADLDRRTLTASEADSLFLADDWLYSQLDGSEHVSATWPATRTEVREALQRAAAHTETVALSGQVIVLRNEVGAPCAYLHASFQPVSLLSA